MLLEARKPVEADEPIHGAGEPCGDSLLLAKPKSLPKVLVVEDQYVIALDLSEALERSNIHVLGPVATLDAAINMLRRHDDIAGAVLDVKLQGLAIYPVAEALRRRGVPFVFNTGYAAETIPPAFRDAVHCEKPMAAAKVIRALRTQMVG